MERIKKNFMMMLNGNMAYTRKRNILKLFSRSVKTEGNFITI